MDFKNVSNADLRELLLKHHKKSTESPNEVTQEDLNEAWDAAFEALMRNTAKMEEQEQTLDQLQNEFQDLIITDITYRAAYKFIYEKGIEKEFQDYLMQSLDDVVGKVIPFPIN